MALTKELFLQVFRGDTGTIIRDMERRYFPSWEELTLAIHDKREDAFMTNWIYENRIELKEKLHLMLKRTNLELHFQRMVAFPSRPTASEQTYRIRSFIASIKDRITTNENLYRHSILCHQFYLQTLMKITWFQHHNEVCDEFSKHWKLLRKVCMTQWRRYTHLGTRYYVKYILTGLDKGKIYTWDHYPLMGHFDDEDGKTRKRMRNWFEYIDAFPWAEAYCEFTLEPDDVAVWLIEEKDFYRVKRVVFGANHCPRPCSYCDIAKALVFESSLRGGDNILGEGACIIKSSN